MLKNVIRILPFFIVTLISIAMVELFYGVVEHYLFQPTRVGSGEQNAAKGPGQSTKVVEKHTNYEVIVERNLFQSYLDEPVVVEPVAATPLVDLEATSLDLVLMGTVGGSAENSRAIIMEKAKRKQDIYYRGDVVQGAMIKEILRGKVVLTYQGRDEVLDMAEAGKYKPRQAPVMSAFPGEDPAAGAMEISPQEQPQPFDRLPGNAEQEQSGEAEISDEPVEPEVEPDLEPESEPEEAREEGSPGSQNDSVEQESNESGQEQQAGN